MSYSPHALGWQKEAYPHWSEQTIGRRAGAGDGPIQGFGLGGMVAPLIAVIRPAVVFHPPWSSYEPKAKSAFGLAKVARR